MILHTLADITGDGAAHALSATSPFYAKWVQIVTPNSNSASIRIGGVNTSSSRGLPIPSGWAGMLLPPVAEISEFYDLSQIYYYAAANDKLYVLYGG